jgi:hypothetical protein
LSDIVHFVFRLSGLSERLIFIKRRLLVPESTIAAVSRSARNRVSIDLQGSKDAWLSWCHSVGLSPSEALREVVRRLQPGAWPTLSNEASPAAPVQRPRRTQRVRARFNVRLDDEEWQYVNHRAEEEGLSVPRWIVGLIRAHLCGQPQLGAPSLEALRCSNLAVQAVGRNLNQLVRALNAINDHLTHGRLSEAAEGIRTQRGETIRGLVQQVRTTIDGHLPVVCAVLTDNVRRWRVRPPRHRGEISE